jgi:peptidoglycan-N-acetylmuramic acid deacetylase
MFMRNWVGSLLIGIFMSSLGFSQTREIAITIDDLPFVGSANNKEGNLKRERDRFLKIVQAVVDHKIPVTGFVIAGSIEKGQWELLEQFRNDGFLLGNHTYSHKSLNSISAEKYIEDIAHADKVLAPLLTTPKYFRYPYLAESKGQKKQQVHDFLAKNQYIIAPVTIDSKDYNFNAQLLAIPWQRRSQNLNQIKQRYLAFIWNQTLKAEAKAKKYNRESASQILLIHANLLNSHFLGDVIDMYQKNGYKIVSLDEAMKSYAPVLDAPAEGGLSNTLGISDVINSIFKSGETTKPGTLNSPDL